MVFLIDELMWTVRSFIETNQLLLINYLGFFERMIGIKLVPQGINEPQAPKPGRRQLKLPKQAITSTTQTPPQSQYQNLTPKTELLRTPPIFPQQEEQQKPRSALKLPQINKKYSQTYEENNDKDNELLAEQAKTVHSNPFVRKYVEKSSDKIKSQHAINFLSIVGVKPTVRSTSRMSGKDTSNSLAFDKVDRVEKGMRRRGERVERVSRDGRVEKTELPKEDENLRNSKDQTNPIQFKTKKRRISTNVNSKSSTNQKIQSVSKPKKNNTAHSTQKKRSSLVLRLQKPKIPPTYFEWCLFLDSLNGIISQKESAFTYKAFVGKGNNSILIKNVIKARPWWILSQEPAQVNFNWTQNKNPKYLQSLKQGPQEIPLQWDKSIIKTRMHLFNQIESLNQKSSDSLGIGFHKLLTSSQRQIFTKSPLSANIYLPTQPRIFQSTKLKLHNHLQFHWHLSNKKALYYNMKAYYTATGQDPFQHIPETYHVQKQGDEEWNRFINNHTKKSLWIIKPGQNSNQGCGIDVVEGLDQVREIVRSKSTRANGKPRSHIIQRYLMPFLYNKRKFDIRCYLLVTCVNSHIRCYWYQQGYVRTASKQFTTKNLKNRLIHLTNDAVQKHSQNYGKHQSGNKLSFADFQKYVKNTRPDHDFYQESYPRMVQLSADAMRASHLVIDAKHRQFSFEIFGLDFMLDQQFNTWLIQVNTNPCLELSCPLLARLIPSVIQNSFRIAVDPIFPPPKDYSKQRGLPQDSFESNKFTLIFSSNEQPDLSKVLQPSRLQDIVQSDQQSDCQKFQ